MPSKSLKGLGLAFTVLGFLVLEATAQEAGGIKLQVRNEVGQNLTYKNYYRTFFSTPKADDLMNRPSGSGYREELEREWYQDETVKETEGVSYIVTTPRNVYEKLLIDDLEEIGDFKLLEGVELRWKVGPKGMVTEFGTSRGLARATVENVVSDLRLFWKGEFYPALPDEPKAVGESWNTDRTVSSVFEGRQFESRMEYKGTATIKKMKKKKNRRCAEIKETQKVLYTGIYVVGPDELIIEGKGKGTATWLLDVENGVVVEHKNTLEFQPKVRHRIKPSPPRIIGDLRIWVERKLK